LLEALSVGCTVVASDTAPVREVMRDGHNGLLTDFFDVEALATRIVQVLAEPAAHAHLALQARADMIERYDLQTRCLPAWLAHLG
jgi:glycosyltransferase involved in cell wall biosynthesis